MKTNGKVIATVLVIAVFLGFLGIPVPDWLSTAVNSLAETINAIITGFSKLIAFIQIFVRF